MKRRLLKIILIISIVFLAACTNQSAKETKNIDEKEKAPESLAQILEGIDELLISTHETVKIAELTEMEFKTEQAGGKDDQKRSGGEDKEQKNQSGNHDNDTGGNQGQEDEMTKDQDLFIKWKQIDEKSEKIHKDWNDYETEAIKKGASPEKILELKKQLNSFAKAIEKRQIEGIMNTGSKAINSLAPFFDLYKDELDGDISRINYSLYQAFLKAGEGDIKTAGSLLDEAVEHVRRVRQRLDEDKDKDKLKQVDKLSLSISDIKLALSENSMKLLEIKRDIALRNARDLKEKTK